MKFILGLFSFSYLFLIGIAMAVVGVVFVFQMPGPLGEAREIQIKKGQGVRDIAQMLQDDNIIMNAYPFMVGAKLKNGGKPLQAGEFLIPARYSMSNVLDVLQNGITIQRKFTVPEGKTSYQIVQILNDTEFLDGDITDIPPEGSLMPDTYFYAKGDTRMEKIARMQSAMVDFIGEQDQSALDNLPLETMEEVMILASIVEKETSVPTEYAKVAGVFINRLNINMPLQTDPTVIYGITNGEHKNEGKGPLGRRLLTKDIRKDTPYNTYTRPGLTPTPICNPGRAAIEGVLNPAKHDYLYFVADGTGGHAFAKTYKGHQANVAKWRKIRRSQ
jgi:UPF0755 protein